MSSDAVQAIKDLALAKHGKFKKFHFAIVGKVIFEVEGEDDYKEATLNAVITNKENKIPAQMLGKMQQALQANLAMKLNDASFKPIDVVLLNIMPLGHMTDEEFNKAPDGMALQETE